MLETAQGRPSANQSKAEREPDLARTNMEKEPEPFAMEDEPHHGDCRAENQSGAKVKVARAESNWDRPHVTVYSSLTPEFSCKGFHKSAREARTINSSFGSCNACWAAGA